MDAETAEAVAAAALQSPLVASLAGGGGAETYLPGRRLAGVRVTDDRVEIHVVARWDADLQALGRDVRRAVAAVTGERTVEVHVDDIEVPIRSRSA